ncbi:2EXR domain-containing protein [Fusarium falciforme]|uniref:2EXR domain-containing protein n=1 Tax=Fusarium falciforme TaxID=195108 RepID=UPI0023011208|nr:2EXR domain-containing protein [Fusarium falciforme]WAO85634.1 2EXR domain-containing protein [Fusarium falciforme]
MSETFHPFPRLPAELRLAIWKLAVRSGGKTLPGVHFFGIVIPGEDEDVYSLMSQSLIRRKMTGFRDYYVVGPRWMTVSTEDRFVGIKREPASWTDNNPSTYLIDCGLWLACWESQHVIHHAFDGLVQRTPYSQIPWGIKDRPIAVYPDQDLFCFQPYDWYTFELNFADFLGDFFGAFVQNIAIDYVP